MLISQHHASILHAFTVVSAAFCLLVGLLSIIAFEALAKPEGRVMGKMLHWELLAWSCPLGYFVLRFASLGSRTNDRCESHCGSPAITYQRIPRKIRGSREGATMQISDALPGFG